MFCDSEGDWLWQTGDEGPYVYEERFNGPFPEYMRRFKAEPDLMVLHSGYWVRKASSL
jgi:hypothetical protein